MSESESQGILSQYVVPLRGPRVPAACAEIAQTISAYREGGQLDSIGQFTIDRLKAKQKISAYQLPRAQAWVLKVLQFLFLSGAQSCEVRITALETLIEGEVDSPANSDDFVKRLIGAELSPDLTTDELKSALWHAGFQQGRAFSVLLPGDQQTIVWQGKDVLLQPTTRPSDRFQLQLSHGPASRPAKVRAEIADELCNGGFSYPLPLSLDGRRLDALQLNPQQGCPTGNYPIRISPLRFEGPSLGTPPATLDFSPAQIYGPSRGKLHHHLVGLLNRVKPLVPFQGVLYLTAHLRFKWSLRGLTWQSGKTQSQVYWVRHGVVVQQEALPWEPASVSCGILLPADDLATDLSGLRLIEGPEKARRIWRSLRAADPNVQRVKFHFEKPLKEQQKGQREDATLVACLSLFPSLVFPPTLLLTVAGLTACKLASDDVSGGLHKLEEDLKNLQVAMGKRAAEG